MRILIPVDKAAGLDSQSLMNLAELHISSSTTEGELKFIEMKK